MDFNPKQRKIFIGGIVIFLLIGVVPPWKQTFKSSSTYSEVPAGYSFIMSPPSQKFQGGRYGIKIDLSRLVIQWIITIIATSAGIILIAKKTKEPQPPTKNPPLKNEKSFDYKDLLKKYQEAESARGKEDPK